MPLADAAFITRFPATDCRRGDQRRDQSAGRSLITADGVRGVYLNELDRNRAADWSAAFASILWEETPRIGRSMASLETVPSSVDDGHAESISARASSPIAPLTPTSARRGPVVVIGFDERPSSPDLMMGVSLGLRRMGCHVIDLGQTTSPCFHFAVHHLEAAGGIFVTGAGCDPAWIGLRLADRTASPWGNPDQWHQLESRATTKVERPTRTAGTQRPFHADIPYQAGLWKLFHALRPLNIVCGTATRQLPRVLDALFARLPCQLTHESLPTRRRDLSDSRDADIRRIGNAVVARQQHLGLVVDDDGERCAFLTDRGDLVSLRDLTRLLVSFELHEHRTVRVVLDDAFGSATDWLTCVGSASPVDRASRNRLPAILMQHKSNLGVTADHRVWFGGDYPACDAILTLARVLQALSLSDRPMSEVLRSLDNGSPK